MAQFSYKGEEFPYSPKEIHLSAAKRLGQFPLAFGGTIIQQLGKELLEISGTGELTGDLAGEFARLYRLFSQSDSGILQLPGFSPIHCYFTALEGVGQPGPAVLEYRFTFVEDPAYADILGASGARSAQLLEGETLYTLARRLGVNAAELIAANPQIADPMSPERGEYGMAALTVTGYDSGGTGHSLTQLLSFGWECSKSRPYASLELSALDVPGANWFHRLEVSLNGSTLFSGRMDTQVWEQTVSGSLCRLTARSATAALVDNEAAPVAYQNYTLDQLLFDHAYPYGVTGSTLSGGTLSQILCTKGMSHWDFLQFYCRLLLGYLPWVNEEGILMGRQETGERVSFVQGDYESFTLSLDRTGLISRLYVLDSTGQYRPITNNFAQALLGEKTEYYAPPGRWSQNLTQAAGNRFREGQLDYLTGKLVLPGLHRYRLGQRVDFSGDGIAFSGMELSGIALFGDSGGFHTTLTLSDPAAGNI